MTQQEIDNILQEKANEINKLKFIPFGKAKDITGQIFGNLYVLGRAEQQDSSSKNRTYIYCLCLACQNHNIITALKDNVVSGKTKSCGCLRHETSKQHAIKINHARKLNLTGQTFGNLYVVEEDAERSYTGRYYWKCKCLICNRDELYSVRTDQLVNGLTTCCGYCNKYISHGESKIMSILRENHIQFETQKTFDTCRFPDTNALAKFDFYIPKYNYLIEYDGQQHYKEVQLPTMFVTKEYVENHDNFKNQWCRENNIPLIRIPYTHLNKIMIIDLIPQTSSFVI